VKISEFGKPAISRRQQELLEHPTHAF